MVVAEVGEHCCEFLIIQSSTKRGHHTPVNPIFSFAIPLRTTRSGLSGSPRSISDPTRLGAISAGLANLLRPVRDRLRTSCKSSSRGPLRQGPLPRRSRQEQESSRPLEFQRQGQERSRQQHRLQGAGTVAVTSAFATFPFHPTDKGRPYNPEHRNESDGAPDLKVFPKREVIFALESEWSSLMMGGKKLLFRGCQRECKRYAKANTQFSGLRIRFFRKMNVVSP